MLNYDENEIADIGAYDLVHYDDLSYVASAHQERKITLAYFLIWNETMYGSKSTKSK